MTKLEKDQRCSIISAEALSSGKDSLGLFIVCVLRAVLLLVDTVFDGLEEIKAAIERSE